MANNIKMKRSAVAGKVPTTTDLALGEIAINTYDGIAYIKKDVSGTQTVVPIGAGNVTSSSSSSTDNAVVRFDGTTGKVIQNSVVTLDDTGNQSGILSQTFSNGSAVTVAAGKFCYDGSTGSWNMGMGGGNITQQVGEELFIYGKASAAITDSPLQIVYHTGTVGSSGVIKFAPTVSGITDVNAIIGVATENIALNGFGRITSFGVIHGINTTGSAFGETWSDDDVIWYNPVTGNPTNVKPVAPNMKVQVGLVINAGSGGSGSFQVLLQSGTQLGGTDSNVQFGTLANNNLIQYNSTLGYWTNVATLPNSNLQNSSITINGTPISLGGSVTTGTVTSVGITAGTGISVSGSPITSSGNITVGLTSIAMQMIYDTFTATASQTSFTTSQTYTSGKISVYKNGTKMRNGTDVTVTSGTAVVFAVACTVNDTIDFVYPAVIMSNQMIYDIFTATASQTTFTTSTTYTANKIEVYRNGAKMRNGTDVTTTSGTAVVFATGLTVGDLVDLVYPV